MRLPGNDLNDGISEATAWKTINKINGTSFNPGDTILFKRGELWREHLLPKSGNATGYITFGAYGTGSKPSLLGSIARNDISDWSNERGNVWTTSAIPYDVGNVIFNNEASTGVKVRNESELDTQGEFWYDEANSLLKLYSQNNPASYYTSIECALKRHIINQSGRSYIIYDNLHLRYGGAHGIGGASVHHIIIRDSDFSYIGGSRQYGEVRYGNGIEFWNDSYDTVVERCRLWEIFDAALTTQGLGGGNNKYNQYFRNNTIWNAEYCFEYWNQPETSTTYNIYFENNTCINAGYGWGHSQRWLETDEGWENGKHLVLYPNTAATADFYVLNNIFYHAKNELYSIESVNNYANFIIDHNILYQPSGVMIDYCFDPVNCYQYTINQFTNYQSEIAQDLYSVTTNPLFIDEANRDFHPAAGSPACTLSETGYFVGSLPCVDIANDTDRDGMPDAFENLFALNPVNPDDVNDDLDADGLINLWEYLYGTDPSNPDTDGDGTDDSDDTCPLLSPVHLSGTYFSSLQSAYVASLDGDTIESHGTVFMEDIIFNMNKSITLESGYDCSYSESLNTTTVIGNVTIKDGEFILQKGVLDIRQQ